MEKFELWSITDKAIVLKKAEDVEKLYNALTNDGGDAIIVCDEEEGKKKCRVLFPPLYCGKIKNGEILISSEESITGTECGKPVERRK